jgi:hypothetical protein
VLNRSAQKTLSIANIIDKRNPTNWFSSAKLVEYSLRVFSDLVLSPYPQDRGLYTQALVSELIPSAKVAIRDIVHIFVFVIKEETT